MLVFYVFLLFLLFIPFSAGLKDLSVYEKTTAVANAKVGIKNDGRFEPSFLPNSRKIKIKKSQTCGNKLFPHGMYIHKGSKTPKMFCETNHCKALKEIKCEKNVSTENCNGYFGWIAGFGLFKNGSSDVTKVECCKFKEETFSTFVKFINFTSAEDYIHEITVDGGNLKSFDYLTNVQRVESGDNRTVYSAAVFRMECFKFKISDDGMPSHYNDEIFARKWIKTAVDAKRDAALMRVQIALAEKRQSENFKFAIVQPSWDLRKEVLLPIGFSDNSWPPELQKYQVFGGSSNKERSMFVASRYRLIAAEIASKHPFGYYYKDITMPSNPDEILKRYTFVINGKDETIPESEGKEVEIETFRKNPVPYSGGVMETDNGWYDVHERNAASGASSNPNYNRLMISYDRETFINFYSRNMLQYRSIDFGANTVYLRDSCGSDLFPHGTYIDRDTNSLMMFCETHFCLESSKINCTIKSSVKSCNGDQKWVAGFKTKENDTVLEVECCEYEDYLDTTFQKEVKITAEKHYDHDLIVKDGKLGAFDFLNNFRMFKTENHGIIYKASVYRTKCPKEMPLPMICTIYND